MLVRHESHVAAEWYTDIPFVDLVVGQFASRNAPPQGDLSRRATETPVALARCSHEFSARSAQRSDCVMSLGYLFTQVKAAIGHQVANLAVC